MNGKDLDLASLAREWLHHEAAGARLRLAHRFVEWDGWEEGLVDSILGPEEHDEEWFKDIEIGTGAVHAIASPPLSDSSDSEDRRAGAILASSLKRRKPSARLPFVKEKEKEQMLNTTGDICGGRGGELGRRLEAWLVVNGAEEGHVVVRRHRNDEDDKNYEAEAE